MTAGITLVKRLERLATALESVVLVVLLCTLMVLAVAQIVLREIFHSGLIWADDLIRYLVLWIALTASIAAARNNRHLRIDAMSQFVAARFARYPRIIVDLFAAFVCGTIAWHSLRFVLESAQYGETVMVDTPAWIVFSLLPFSMVAMGLSFLVFGIGGLIGAVGPADVESGDS